MPLYEHYDGKVKKVNKKGLVEEYGADMKGKKSKKKKKGLVERG